jgi:hypothetical protein
LLVLQPFLQRAIVLPHRARFGKRAVVPAENQIRQYS